MAAGTAVGMLRPGDHVCLPFSDDRQRLDVLAEFVADGFRAGHKVVLFTDSVPPDVLTERLRARAPAGRPGQLHVHPAEPSYLPGAGFEPDRMLDLLVTEIDAAVGEGYP